MDTKRLRLIELTGTPRERGRIHGEELRDSIRQVIESKRESLRTSPGADLDRYLRDFLSYGRFERAIREQAPLLWEEVDGLAEGAAISPDTARFLQLADEEWVYREKVCSDATVNRDACTAFAVNTDRGTLAGQNMDTGYIDPHQVLFRITHPGSDLESYVFSVAGTLGLNGMSNVPLGICCNTLLQMRSCTKGLPVALIVRRVLECDSFEDAVSFISRIRHASGQNYIVAAPGQVGSFECSAGKVAAVKGSASIDGIWHTNHPLVNDDLEPSEVIARTQIAGRYANSKARLQSIGQRFVAAGAEIRIGDIKHALGAHDDNVNPVCRHFDPAGRETLIGYTAGSMIYELNPEDPTLHVASGPPCHTEYRAFRLSRKGESVQAASYE